MNSNKKDTKQPQQPKNAANDIRVGINTRVSSLVRYCNGLFKEKTFKTLHFSAVGGVIWKLVSAVEVLKVVNSGLYQSNKLATVSYQPNEDKEKVKNQRLFPKMEILLSFEDIKDKNDGYQKKLDEVEREKLYQYLMKNLKNV